MSGSLLPGRSRLGTWASTVCLLLAGTAAAAPMEIAPPPQARIVQQPGAALPLDLRLQDAQGHAVALRDFFRAGRPVVLVPGYYRCTNLCSTVMQGVLEALADTGLPRSAYTVVGFGIEPEESPADARAREDADRAYAQAYGSRLERSGTLPPVDLHLLLGAQADTALLAERIGWGYARAQPAPGSAADPGVAHEAGFVVATGDGTVSRYLLGVRFDPHELRLALVDASAGRVGTLDDRIALLCAHFDPRSGRYNGAVLLGLRVAGIALALGLAGWIVRHRGGRGGRPA